MTTSVAEIRRLRGALEVAVRFITGNQLEHAIINHPDKPEKELGAFLREVLVKTPPVPISDSLLSAAKEALEFLSSVYSFTPKEDSSIDVILDDLEVRLRTAITEAEERSS